jgi:hypothetical protein
MPMIKSILTVLARISKLTTGHWPLATIVVLLLGAGGCNKLGVGAQKPDSATPTNMTLYNPDLTKPDGPMLQIFRAAQDRDADLFKASFAPSVNSSRFDDDLFRKFRKKVLTSAIAPVPESVQQISDTEAVVHARNKRGREIPIHVQKVGDKWLITKIEFGTKSRDKYRETHQDPAAKPTTP